MKISEVAERGGATVSTVKYYLRERLVPEGERLSPNQTAYDESHVRRVRLVRALLETGGLSIAAAKRVLSTIDADDTPLPYAFEAAQHALGVGGASAAPASSDARGRIQELAETRSWRISNDNPGLDVAARVVDGLGAIGFEPSDDYLAAYASAATSMARADLTALLTRDDPDLTAELMIVGTVLGDALSAGLRRLAQQDATAEFFPLPETEPESEPRTETRIRGEPEMTTHIVLGGTGVVGRETISALRSAGYSVTSVGRTPSADAAVPRIGADLRDAASAARALQGADVAYFTVGLPYSTQAWRRDWPVILGNTIDACIANGTHLVYFDNVYAYGRTDAPMTEATPIRPSSRKGEIRAALLETLATAARERGLGYTVGRSADFYGPGATTSVFNMFAIDRVVAGKPPTWLFDATQPHSMTYTPDIGRALAVLGTDPRARGRIWHLPTAPALTGDEYLALATGGAQPHRTMSMTTMRMGAVFSSAARGALELAYQNTEPYRFDSTAFEREFGIAPTPYAEGIAASLEHARGASGALRGA